MLAIPGIRDVIDRYVRLRFGGDMSDKELLELAAKAAGYKFDSTDPFEINDGKEDGGCWRDWNPLENDGDALRLAVKLGMDMHIYLPTGRELGRSYITTKTLIGYGTDGYASYQDSACSKENHQDDLYAATRRAIVRSAVELERIKP